MDAALTNYLKWEHAYASRGLHIENHNLYFFITTEPCNTYSFTVPISYFDSYEIIPHSIHGEQLRELIQRAIDTKTLEGPSSFQY